MKIKLNLYVRSNYHGIELPPYCKGVGVGFHADNHSGFYQVKAIDKVQADSAGNLSVYATPLDDDPNVPEPPKPAPLVMEPISEPAAVAVPCDHGNATNAPVGSCNHGEAQPLDVPLF